MIVFNTAEQLKNHLNDLRAQNKTIGFAPTMGALHQGHISLISIAHQHCDVVVCSVFVNPTQFNDLKDLDKYPRTILADTSLLKTSNCDILFAPEVSEIYTEEELEMKRNNQEDRTWMEGKSVDFGLLDKVMEGAQRPGHFNGVAQVVSKLFRLVNPDKAFFGQKDFQQLSIIKSMVTQLGMPIEIVACPIVREEDGLAMSSRNRRLTPEERKEVPSISKLLFFINDIYKTHPIKRLKEVVENYYALEKLIQLEYFEIVDSETLQPITNFNNSKSAVACIAVKLESVRLIDNVILY
ncbi:MAG: pantoate--beta-alanine ligase [Bacteroidota bacterium]